MKDTCDRVRPHRPSGQVVVLNNPLFLGMKVKQGYLNKKKGKDKCHCVVVMVYDLEQEHLGSCPPAV